MANSVMDTRMMAPPTPINTPSTGEMINRVFNDPILAWFSRDERLATMQLLNTFKTMLGQFTPGPPSLTWLMSWVLVTRAGGLSVLATSLALSLSPRRLEECTVSENVFSDCSPSTWKFGCLPVMFRILGPAPAPVLKTFSVNTWVKPPSNPGWQETKNEEWVWFETEQFTTGSGLPVMVRETLTSGNRETKLIDASHWSVSVQIKSLIG